MTIERPMRYQFPRKLENFIILEYLFKILVIHNKTLSNKKMYRDNEPLAESTSNPPNTEAIQKCQTRNSLFDLKDVFTSRNELNLGLLIKVSLTSCH